MGICVGLGLHVDALGPLMGLHWAWALWALCGPHVGPLWVPWGPLWAHVTCAAGVREAQFTFVTLQDVARWPSFRTSAEKIPRQGAALAWARMAPWVGGPWVGGVITLDCYPLVVSRMAP